MKLRQKAAEELKSQLQDFLSNSPYAEQLQGLLALSEEELQDPHAVQKFLEQQHLDPQIWTEYIDRLKVRNFLEKKPYFLHPCRFPEYADFTRKALLAQELRVLKLLEEEGFLANDVNYYLKIMMEKLYHTEKKTLGFDNLQFLLEHKIMTLSTIQSMEASFFTIPVSILKKLKEKGVFATDGLWGKFIRYLNGGSKYIHKLACIILAGESVKDFNILSLSNIDSYKYGDFLSGLDSKKFDLVVNFAKAIQPKDWSNFFGTIYYIIQKDNYQYLLTKLQQKYFFTGQANNVFFVLLNSQNKIGEILDLDEGSFISLIQFADVLKKYFNNFLIENYLSRFFQKDRYHCCPNKILE